MGLFENIRDFVRLIFLGNEITSAVRKCRTLLAEKCIPITKLARERGMAVVALTNHCQSAMRGLGDDCNNNRGLEAPKIYLKIQHLLDESNLVESIASCKEMAQMAKELVGYTNDMANTLQKAIDSLPERYQHDDDGMDETKPKKIQSRSALAQAIQVEDDVDTQEIMKLLSNVEADIQDLYKSSNQARGGLDIFTASSLGSKVFDLTQSKGQLAVDLFQQMSNLNTVLMDLVSSVLVDNTCCCTKLHSTMKSVTTLLRSQTLVKVLVQAGTAVERLMDALKNLIEVAWQKMQGFLEQFAAAKKLGKFVKDVKGKLDTGKGVLQNIRKKGKDVGKRMFGL